MIPVDQEILDGLCSRTDAKLRYATVHLEELRRSARRGDDFDRSHQESFLFHLYGVIDALLQELNVRFQLDLLPTKVTLHSLVDRARKKGVNVQNLEAISNLESNPKSWLSQAKEMRHYSMHRNSVPRTYFKGGERDGEVILMNTKTDHFVELDFTQLFGKWVDEMKTLVTGVRSS